MSRSVIKVHTLTPLPLPPTGPSQAKPAQAVTNSHLFCATPLRLIVDSESVTQDLIDSKFVYVRLFVQIIGNRLFPHIGLMPGFLLAGCLGAALLIPAQPLRPPAGPGHSLSPTLHRV